MPSQFLLKSTEEFLLTLQDRRPTGIMASLDVENLFTNIPIVESIDIILNYVYNHDTIRPPQIPRNLLRNLLMTCTTESPFQGLDGTLYQQKDGLAMGSPLSCVIANFYLCHIENEIMEDAALKPSLYSRFIDA